MSNESESITARLARHGFHFAQLGGGCTGYLRHDTGNARTAEVEEIITRANEPRAPEALTDAVAIGTTCFTAPSTDETQYTHGYTLADVLAALDNAGDEWALLDMALHNGAHKAVRNG